MSNNRDLADLGKSAEAIDVDASAPADSLNINSSGNVGIGTTSPDNVLHIKADAPIIKLEDNQAGGGYHQLGNSSSDGTLVIYADADGTNSSTANMRFNVGSTEHMRINSSGQVGIGTSSPAQKFHLDSSTNTRLRVSTTNTGSVPEIQLYNAAKEWKIGVETSTDAGGGAYSNAGASSFVIRNQTDTTTAMAIDTAGRVTKPYQPAFMAQRTGGSSNPGQYAVYPFNTTYYNIGSHYNTSTYRFTAPVAGLYMFGMQLLTDNSGNRVIVYLRINGSNGYNTTQAYEGSADTEEYNNVQINALFKLNANDYVDTYIEDRNALYNSANGQNKFWGVLIA